MAQTFLTNEDKDELEQQIGKLSAEIENKPASIVGTSVGEKCAEFSYLLNNSDKTESFLFFTDPHLAEGDSYEAQMRSYLSAMKTYYDATPVSFALCGGDWMGNSDTQKEACFKLGFIDAQMRSNFDRYYHVIGNHDTNYQGVTVEGAENFSGTLTNETIRNLMLRNEENPYYSFEGARTKFYVLDTGSDWKEPMTDYRWEQIAWLAEKLKTDDAEFSALAMHIGYNSSYAQPPLSANATALCEAYNNRETITLNGVTYDFTGCTGSVKFALCGHIHADYVLVANGVPVISTTHTRDGSTASFDMCVVDYDADEIYMCRVGTGANRAISLIDGSVTEWSGEIEEDDDGQPDWTIAWGLARTGGRLYPVANRCCAVSTTPIGTVTPYAKLDNSDYTGIDWKDYYPIPVPDGATQITVTCPSDTKWAFLTVNSIDGNVFNNEPGFTDSGWLTPGGSTYAVPASAKCCMVLFHNNTGTTMNTNNFSIEDFGIVFS